MIYSKQTAAATAQHLLQINAIKLNPENPFTWASGWKSPIYCDNRLALSYPEVRDFLAVNLAQQVEKLYGTNVTIAGVATGAIGIGMLVAEKLNLPFIYVRPEPKKHGRQNQIEGHAPVGKPIVVIEDLISTGKSSLNAVRAIKQQNFEVLGMLALFSYGFNVAEENFGKENIQLHTLSNYDHLLQFANQEKAITDEQLAALSLWRKDPANWTP
ncbi:MAG: orotate phosphoribosyltransferase [Candidatus Arcticimaribacter sp.]